MYGDDGRHGVEPRRLDFSKAYVRRLVDDELDTLFAELPALLLDGPKGVGKTATASQRCRTVWRLDRELDAATVAADPSAPGRQDKPVLLDEWHRLPELWDAVRRLVDDDNHGGQYLLTGSVPPLGMHSGAGRIVTMRMRPLTLSERGVTRPTVSFAELLASASSVSGTTPFGLEDYVDEILASGFPGLRRYAGAALDAQLDSYLSAIVDRDLPEAGLAVRRPRTVHGWLRAYAAATATTATWETIRDAATPGQGAKPARTTTVMYTELLTRLRILDPIEAWVPSNRHFQRLGSAPKHHLVDPALAARALDRTKADLLLAREPAVAVPRDGPLLGALFESLVALSVRTYAQRLRARVSHLRVTGGRHEVDFIIESGDRVLALEAKLGAVPSDRDVRHLLWLREQLGDRLVDAAVVTTGTAAYRRPDGIAVIPLALLGP